MTDVEVTTQAEMVIDMLEMLIAQTRERLQELQRKALDLRTVQVYLVALERTLAILMAAPAHDDHGTNEEGGIPA